MSVTREVSQLSGWLKARAACRGSQAGHTVRGGLRAWRRGRRRASAMCAKQRARGLQLQNIGQRGAGSTAHVEHVVDVCDAGGVPIQWLVKGPCRLPRVASRAHGTGQAAGRAACTQWAGERAATAEIRGEARGEQRTANMRFMSVTRDVSQPEMSALKLRKKMEKR